MTKRLEVLKASLVKKEAELDRRMQAHFDTVKQANGQPLNDKRNGQATLNKWDKQNNAATLFKNLDKKTLLPSPHGLHNTVLSKLALLPVNKIN